MCSDCSGDYEGDGEWPEWTAPELDERMPVGDAGCDGRLAGKSETHETRGSDTPSQHQGVGEYEVLVSAGYIVEVRRISAISLISWDLGDDEADDGCVAGSCAIKQSRSASAKYYQTCPKLETLTRHSSRPVRKELLHWSLALLALTGAVLWLTLR